MNNCNNKNNIVYNSKCQEHVEMQINEGSEVLFAPKELCQEIIGLLTNNMSGNNTF